jgi:hypothetical protein
MNMCSHDESGIPVFEVSAGDRDRESQLIRAAADEVRTVDLVDALAIVLVMADRRDASYERAATRWLARLALERSTVGLGDLRLGPDALEHLASKPAMAKLLMAELCVRHGLRLTAELCR